MPIFSKSRYARPVIAHTCSVNVLNLQFRATIYDYFEKKCPKGLGYKYIEIKNETHATMVFPVPIFGLRDIFSECFFELDEKANETSQAGELFFTLLVFAQRASLS